MHKVLKALKAGTLLILLAGAGLVRAQTVVVTSLADAGPGTLRQALADVVAGGSIVFDNASMPGTITLTSGQLLIDKDLTITGPGADRLAISGNDANRLFEIVSGVTVEIDALTIQNGNATTESVRNGGAILNAGTLTLSHCVVQNSRAGDGPDGQSSSSSGRGGHGGGIVNFGSGASLTVLYSTIVGNRAGDGGDSPDAAGYGGQGGGIFSFGSLTVSNSTIAANRAGDAGEGPSIVAPGDGGGIMAFLSSTIRSSTISGNMSGGHPYSVVVGYGGGIALNGGTVSHTTITNNSVGGGLVVFPTWQNPITVTNSIIAGNGYWECIDKSEHEWIILSGGYNITEHDGGCNLFTGSDLLVAEADVFTSVLDATLQNNGGPTETHELLSQGVAIDQGSCSSESGDQRGFAASPDGPRPVDQGPANADDGCDVGAYELGAMPVDLIVHFKRPAGWGYPHIHYFETRPDIGSTVFPGEPLLHEGCGWYGWRFNGAASAHMVFNGDSSPETAELFRGLEGWYDGQSNTWSGTNPDPHCTDIVHIGPRAFLEGAYISSGSMSRALQLADALPSTQPYAADAYTDTPLKHHGTESNDQLGSAGAVLATDWSMVELRTGTTADTKVAARAAIHLESGFLVDPVTLGNVSFPGVAPGSYYVVVRHRNHLPVMSADPVSLSLGGVVYDFTYDPASAFGTNPMIQMPDGGWAMRAADANADGNVESEDYDAYVATTMAGMSGYTPADFNLDAVVQALDFNLYIKNTSSGSSSQVP